MSGFSIGIQTWVGSNGDDFFSRDVQSAGFTILGVIPAGDTQFRVSGLNGDDLIAGGGAADGDQLSGGGGADTLGGGAGRDTLDGGIGLDILDGGGDNDQLIETGEGLLIEAASVLNGGEGFDTLFLSGTVRLVSANVTSLERLATNSGTAHQLLFSSANFATFQVLQLGAQTVIQGISGTYDFGAKEYEAVDAIPYTVHFKGGAGDETVIGTDRADDIMGGAGANLIQGGDGGDTLSGAGTIEGGDGDDRISDNPEAAGDDLLLGGVGNDTISSSSGGIDTMRGGEGADSIVAGRGGSLLEGGDGEDTLVGNAFSVDTLRGGADNDVLRDAGMLGAGAVLDGGDGIDVLDIGGGTLLGATLIGIETLLLRGSMTIGASEFASFANLQFDGADNPLINAADQGVFDFSNKPHRDAFGPIADHGITFVGGFNLDDTVIGGDGNDWLIGYGGNDELSGGGGADTLAGGGGNDRLVGGAGDDIASYGGAMAGYTIASLGGGAYTVSSAAEGTDTLSGIERLRFSDAVVALDVPPVGTRDDDDLQGGAGNDLVVAYGGNDTVQGGDGADTLIGGAGNDQLSGGADHDVLSGGVGDDTLDGGAGNDRLVAGAGQDLLLGGDGQDTLYGQDGNDTLAGGDGEDWLYGQHGADLLDGGAGNDVLVGGDGDDTLAGSDGADRLTGDDGADLLDGGADNDVLLGGAGGDTLLGGAGDDVLKGGDGDDSLAGGTGGDRMLGGAGADTFLFAAPGQGSDRIFDFNANEDRILLGAGQFGFAAGPLDALHFEANALGILSAPGSGSMIVYNTTNGRLSWVGDDGSGQQAPVELAVLVGAPSLGVEDIWSQGGAPP